jgi:hypothetical protein
MKEDCLNAPQVVNGIDQLGTELTFCREKKI